MIRFEQRYTLESHTTMTSQLAVFTSVLNLTTDIYVEYELNDRVNSSVYFNTLINVPADI
jgi:hypothetical protein